MGFSHNNKKQLDPAAGRGKKYDPAYKKETWGAH